MRFKEISVAEALESLAEGGKQYILKELCEVTPASEMICARFVVEIPDKIQDENLSGGGKAKSDSERKRKTLDWDKIQALHKAGWSHAKIADEMGATVSTIVTGLSKLRREEKEHGKKQGDETDIKAEEADG